MQWSVELRDDTQRQSNKSTICTIMTTWSLIVKAKYSSDNLNVAEDPKKLEFPQQLGRRARKALAVRQALFDAGLAAFERQPIGLVSVLDITEEADVAKGVFYLQFRSKDDYLLALWEEVQGRMLDSARSAAIDSRSQSARIEAIVCDLIEFVRQNPASGRFWLRMSSYFPDEIGEPGHLSRIRQEFVQQLAGAISGKPMTDLTQEDLRTARLLDAIGWAAIGAEIHGSVALLDAKKLVKAIRAALT